MQEILNNLNKTINSMVCCNFEILKYEKNNLLIGGGFSLSYPHSILIEFESVFFISLVHEWSIDTSKNFISLAETQDALKINQKYRIEIGHTLFKILSDDRNHIENLFYYVSAKNINVKILEVNYLDAFK